MESDPVFGAKTLSIMTLSKTKLAITSLWVKKCGTLFNKSVSILSLIWVSLRRMSWRPVVAF